MDDVDKLLYDNIGEARDIWIRESTNEYIMYEHIFSARFRIMMRKLINKNLPPRMKRMYYVKRAFAIVAIALIASFSCAMSVEAYREKIIDVIERIFSDSTEYRFSSETELHVLPEIEIEYLPINMVETTSTCDILHFFKRYEDVELQLYININITSMGKESSLVCLVDTEDAMQKNIVVRECDATLIEKGVNKTLWWIEGSYAIIIDTNLSEEELLNVVNKIDIAEEE